MRNDNSKSLRVQDDHGKPELPTTSEEGRHIPDTATTKDKKETLGRTQQSLGAKVLSRVFSEDFEKVQTKILDPQGKIIRQWSKIFLVACLVSLFVDPLFFYTPGVSDKLCVETGISLLVILTFIRSVADVFYIIQIFIRLRTAYVAPPSRVFGRGELVIDPQKIASRYFCRGFCMDLIAALPLPQVLMWVIIPNLKHSALIYTRVVVIVIIVFQYLVRLFLVLPLTTQVGKATGFMIETAWLGAAYNLILYFLASHITGAGWYILAIERQKACWKSVCYQESPPCQYNYFECSLLVDTGRKAWFEVSSITDLCDGDNSFYAFGIYQYAVSNGVTSAPFLNKYFRCLCWGLVNLCTLGQNLFSSIYVGETSYCILFGCVGLFLFASLIGNMQRYLLSTSIRFEQWRVKRNDTEKWMHHRQLPNDLRLCIRKYDQYKWLTTRGVDEEALLNGLSPELRRDVKHHLCIDLVRRVPLFKQMDERMLDAICEKLKPALCIEGSFLVREGYPVHVMLFVIRGYLNSYCTDGDHSGLSNSCLIGPGNFCCEELLTWALETNPSITLPPSTGNIKAFTDVEGFALEAEDLKSLASQWRKMHSKQLRHNFRFHSLQWRTWAACLIQAAWRWYQKRKEAAKENLKVAEHEAASSGSCSLLYEAIKEASSRSGLNLSFRGDSGCVSPLQKPAEPDFFQDDNEL